MSTTLFPVYLSRYRDESETTVEEYDEKVAINEDNLNQNLTALYQQINTLQEQVSSLIASATTTEV